MDVTLINPIVAAFTDVLPQIGFQKIERKNISLVGATFSYEGVLINLAMIGSIKGIILIGMNIDSAKSFASKMMMGMEVKNFDGLAQSAISEMGNMVCANACIQFSKIGIEGLNISPPTIMMSQGGGHATLPVPQTVVIDFSVDGIDVKIYVGLVS
jgi:chemotaxis protein CheX